MATCKGDTLQTLDTTHLNTLVIQDSYMVRAENKRHSQDFETVYLNNETGNVKSPA